MIVNKGKLDFVDALRGIAILLVVLVHVAQRIESYPSYFNFVELGQFGVQLFFVLSAFTLCLSWKRRNDGFLFFVIRRVCRVAPMYYIGIFIYFSLYYLSSYVGYTSEKLDSYRFFSVLSNVVFIHSFFPDAQNSIVPGGWSIGVEMFFYLIFPIVFYLYFSSIKIALSLILIVLPLFVYFLYDLDPRNNGFYYYTVFCQLSVFLCGFAAYEIWDKNIVVSSIKLLLSMLIALSFLFIIFFYGADWLSIFMPFLAGFIFLMFLCVSFKVAKWPDILLEIGRRSFSIYILHFVFTIFVIPFVSMFYVVTWPWFIFAYVGVVCCSYVTSGFTYRFIEMYFVKLSNRMIKKLDSEGGARGFKI